MRSQRHFLNSGLKRLNSIYTKMCINFRERPGREEKMERKRGEGEDDRGKREREEEEEEAVGHGGGTRKRKGNW